MLTLEHKLECASCKNAFPPCNTYRLSSNDECYRYQLFMDGICPQCQGDVLAWVGLDAKGNGKNYFPISRKHSRKWYDRLDSDLKKHRADFKIDRKKHSSYRCENVTGSVYDVRSGKYAYRDNIPVR